MIYTAGRDSNWHAKELQPPHFRPKMTQTRRPSPDIPTHNDNHLNDLQGRQRAPLKQLRRCFENHTRNELSMSETSDEEVDYGSLESIANPPTGSDHAWSTFENDSQQ